MRPQVGEETTLFASAESKKPRQINQAGYKPLACDPTGSLAHESATETTVINLDGTSQIGGSHHSLVRTALQGIGYDSYVGHCSPTNTSCTGPVPADKACSQASSIALSAYMATYLLHDLACSYATSNTFVRLATAATTHAEGAYSIVGRAPSQDSVHASAGDDYSESIVNIASGSQILSQAGQNSDNDAHCSSGPWADVPQPTTHVCTAPCWCYTHHKCLLWDPVLRQVIG